MKLTHLDLTSFRSYQGTTLPLDDKRVLIAGLNGSGKSSIREAIKWALTGHCDGTDGRGAGAEVLIPVGSKSAEVAVGIEGIGSVKRTFHEHGGGAFSVEGFTGTSQIQQQALLIKLNTTAEYLDAVLDTDTFCNLSHIDAKALVLSLLGVRVTVNEKDLTLDELDAAYKQAFEDRKAAKKALAGCLVPAKPTATLPSLEQIEGLLTKLRADLGSLRQSIGTVVGQRTALEAEYGRIFTVDLGVSMHAEIIAGLEKQIADLESQAQPQIVAPPAVGDPKRHSYLLTLADDIQRQTPVSGVCVLDGEIQCNTAAKAFSARIGALRAEAETLKGSFAPKPSAPPERPLPILRTRLAAVQREQQQYADDEQRNADGEARRVAIKAELASLQNTAEQDEQIKALDLRIQKGEQLQRDARSHYAALDDHQKAEAKRLALVAEVERLETLVDLLGPKGLRVQALHDAMSRFEAAVNPYLSAFGWTIGFQVEPWTVLANGRPVETYSRSERFRIGIALQLGIAQLSGLRFAVIDEVDMLDVGNRTIVTGMLMKADLDQILILGTREVSQVLPQKILAYRLANVEGRTVIAESTALETVGA